jgi:hypothetical protein
MQAKSRSLLTSYHLNLGLSCLSRYISLYMICSFHWDSIHWSLLGQSTVSVWSYGQACQRLSQSPSHRSLIRWVLSLHTTFIHTISSIPVQMGESDGKWRNTACEYNTHHINSLMNEIETVSKMSDTKSAVIWLIIWEDFIVL